MKCVCGYEYQEYDPNGTPAIGDKEFIELRSDSRDDRLVIFSQRIDAYSSPRYQLFMCPKCGTIRGKRYF